MIRTKNKIYGEMNDPNTVLLPLEGLVDVWLQTDGNKAIKVFEPGPNKILIINGIEGAYYLGTLSWHGQIDGLIGTDEFGNIVFISRTNPNIIVNEDDLIDSLYSGGPGVAGDGDQDVHYEVQ